MNAIDREMVASRHLELLRVSLARRLRIASIAVCIIAYFLFCFCFFAFGKVFSTAHWDIAGAYLADWATYEERPDIHLSNGTMRVVFPKSSSLGADPHPDWLTKDETSVTKVIKQSASETSAARPAQRKQSTFNFIAPDTNSREAAVATEHKPQTVTEKVVSHAHITYSSSKSVDVTAERVEIRNGSETLIIPLGGKDINLKAPLPGWASQPYVGGKVIVSLGFPGWLEVEPDRVKIRKRFFGWANFIFDTNSHFFGKSAGDVWTLVTSGPRLEPAQSNASLALNEFLYNPSWQHLDVWTKLMQTIVMAFVGTLFAAILSFPLSFIAARNVTRSKVANQLTKRFFDFQRSVDMLIWALFFTRAFGPGPLAGISAIFFTDTGTLGKLYSEALENIDNKPREGIKSVGAAPAAIHRFAIVPQVLPVFVSQALYFWESNTRSATIIGAVGAGGIGLKLWEAMRTNSDWENVAYMVVLILIVVYVFDNVSNMLRSKLIGQVSR